MPYNGVLCAHTASIAAARLFWLSFEKLSLNNSTKMILTRGLHRPRSLSTFVNISRIQMHPICIMRAFSGTSICRTLHRTFLKRRAKVGFLSTLTAARSNTVHSHQYYNYRRLCARLQSCARCHQQFNNIVIDSSIRRIPAGKQVRCRISSIDPTIRKFSSSTLPNQAKVPHIGLRVLVSLAIAGLFSFALLYPFAWGRSWLDAPRVFYTALKRNLADFYCVFRMVYTYWRDLGYLSDNLNEKERLEIIHQTHLKCASLLRDLFCTNGGIYIKLGQHLAVLDYVIPEEYVETMQIMFDKAPTSPLEEVFAVIEEDLGKHAHELFDYFEITPIASASLAQVHQATTKDGQKVAVKVQHKGLREESFGDIATVELLVKIVRFFFPAYDYTWLIEVSIRCVVCT